MLLTTGTGRAAGCVPPEARRARRRPAPPVARDASPQRHRLSIATGNTGGVYYVLGGRFGELVTQATRAS